MVCWCGYVCVGVGDGVGMWVWVMVCWCGYVCVGDGVLLWVCVCG